MTGPRVPLTSPLANGDFRRPRQHLNPGNPQQEKFLSFSIPLKFTNHNPTKLDFFPYVNATQDRVKDEVERYKNGHGSVLED